MYLDEIVAHLDVFFKIDTFQPDLPFSSLVPSVYQETQIELEEYLESTFLRRFHGLMIRNSQTVERVCSVVFLSDEMVEKVLVGGGRDVLLISHHPLAMETSNRGFLPLSEACLVAMQNRGISAYVLHTPLDVHEDISTSAALVRELGLEGIKRCSQVDDGGYAGVYGFLPAPIEFDNLLGKVRDATGVADLHFVRNHDVVHTVAVLAGGIGVVDIMEVMALGCDALVTGTYYNLTQNEIGQRCREKFDRIRDSLTISLIECSHYASEAVVMRKDIRELCARFGVACEFVSQDDPWY